MDKLEKSLVTIVDKACGKKGGAIMERLVKDRVSTMFDHPEYSMDGPGPSIAVPGSH